MNFPTIPDALLTQRFGNYNPGLYGTSTPLHRGEDYGPLAGNPVYAPCDGVVEMAGTTGKSGYGGQVRIRMYDGALVIIGHMSKWSVKTGDTVKSGQQIGLSGGNKSDPNSGNSTGDHIHFEYRPPGRTDSDQKSEHPTKSLLEYVPAKLTQITILSYTGMSVRMSPSTSSKKLGDALPRGTVDYITEVKDGWGKLDRLRPEWVFVNNPAWVKMGDTTVRSPKPPVVVPPVTEPPVTEQPVTEPSITEQLDEIISLLQALRQKL